MTVREFLKLFDNWSIYLAVYDSDLNEIYRTDKIFRFVSISNSGLLNENVESFGYLKRERTGYDKDLITIRIGRTLTSHDKIIYNLKH